jgi:hypothetical protein
VKTPRITLTDLAVADILEQADWYEAQADRKLAKRWEEASRFYKHPFPKDTVGSRLITATLSLEPSHDIGIKPQGDSSFDGHLKEMKVRRQRQLTRHGVRQAEEATAVPRLPKITGTLAGR